MSAAGRMIEFFRTASMEVAEFALGQVQDVLRERRAKSQAAKARASKPATAAVATVAPKVAVARKKSKRKAKARRPKPPLAVVEPTLPELDESEAEDLVSV